jgi:spore coat protein U-like protein
VSSAWAPENVNAGSFISTDVPVAGATLGDLASASFSIDLNNLVLSAAVNAADHVTVTLSNNTPSTVNLAQGTLFIRVTKRAIT